MSSSHSPRSAWVGIDIAKATFEVHLLSPQQRAHHQFANTAAGFEHLLAWLTRHHGLQAHICLEATGPYWYALALFLSEHQSALSVLNPAVLVSYRLSHQVRSKTDRLDAQLLALYAQERCPRLWKPLPASIRQLRALVDRRWELLQTSQQERNRLESLDPASWLAQRIEHHLAYLGEELRLLEAELTKEISQEDACKRTWTLLQSIPGIGALSASILLAEIGEIERFERPASLVSLAGLAVQEHQSGTSVHGRPHIDRRGRPLLRRTLYMCALVAMRWDPAIKAWAQRLLARSKPKKVVMVAVMRKLLHLVYGVWKHQTSYDPCKVSDSKPASLKAA